MGNTKIAGVKDSPGKLTILSLVLSSFASTTPGVIIMLLMIDIGQTFGTPLGVTAQIQTVYSVIGVVSALLMGGLSVRYRHKSLLMVGLSFIAISALGCAFAQTFSMMLLLYPLSGLGYGMVGPMCSSLVGELFPLDKRSIALGGITAGMALSYVIGPRTIVHIASVWGWRLAFLGFVLPSPIVALLLAKIGLPSPSHVQQTKLTRGGYLRGFKEIFSNRSAIACLVGVTLAVASVQVGVTFGASFLRQQFKMPSSSVTIVITGVALCVMLGSLGCGRLVNRFGRKPLTISAAFFNALFNVFFVYSVNPLCSSASFLMIGLLSGVRVTASQSLTLEQVPEYRGTTMSIFAATTSLGLSLGSGVGGLVLLWYDWKILGITLGGMGIVSALVFYLLTVDPTTT